MRCWLPATRAAVHSLRSQRRSSQPRRLPVLLSTANGLAIGLAQLRGAAHAGQNGVYYGSRLGAPVKWCKGLPFSLVVHPQYVGSALTVRPSLLAMRTGLLHLGIPPFSSPGAAGMGCAEVTQAGAAAGVGLGGGIILTGAKRGVVGVLWSALYFITALVEEYL